MVGQVKHCVLTIENSNELDFRAHNTAILLIIKIKSFHGTAFNIMVKCAVKLTSGVKAHVPFHNATISDF